MCRNEELMNAFRQMGRKQNDNQEQLKAMKLAARGKTEEVVNMGDDKDSMEAFITRQL